MGETVFVYYGLFLSAAVISGSEAWACQPREQSIILHALELQHQGDGREAEKLLVELGRTLEGSGATGALCLAVVLNNLGSLKQDFGLWAEAERFYLRAIRLEEQQGGASVDTSATLDNLGSLYFETGQYRKAERLRRRAIDLRISRFGPEHPSVAFVLQNLAAQKYAQGDMAESSKLYERAFGIWHASGLEDSPDAAIAIHGLGLLYARKGELAKATRYVEWALRLWARSPNVSVSTARAEANLAVLKLAQGNGDAAGSHWRRAIDMAEQSTGPQSPVTREILYGYMVFLRRMQRSDEARTIQARIHRIDKALGDHPAKGAIIDITQLANRSR